MTADQPAERVSKEEAALVLAVTDVYAKGCAATDKAARKVAAVERYLRPGETIAVPDPDDPDGVLALVAMSKPSAKAEVHDQAALLAHIAETVENGTIVETRIVSGVSHDAVLDVLARHAPDLVEDYRVPADWAVKQETKRALDGADVPGVTVVRPRVGSITVRDADETRLRALVATGRVDPLVALPAAPAA